MGMIVTRGGPVIKILLLPQLCSAFCHLVFFFCYTIVREPSNLFLCVLQYRLSIPALLQQAVNPLRLLSPLTHVPGFFLHLLLDFPHLSRSSSSLEMNLCCRSTVSSSCNTCDCSSPLALSADFTCNHKNWSGVDFRFVEFTLNASFLIVWAERSSFISTPSLAFSKMFRSFLVTRAWC